jgi:hypothetical protein
MIGDRCARKTRRCVGVLERQGLEIQFPFPFTTANLNTRINEGGRRA